jgi:uncharacterized protein YecE (DUF72 family)
VAERRSVAADVVGSNPTSRPNLPSNSPPRARPERLLAPAVDPARPCLPRAPKFTPIAAASLAPSPRNLFAGTSGWAYPTWKPGFYPAGVPSSAFLHFYASQLTSVEVNYTFRALPTPTQLQTWLDATPPGFRFSFKAPQRITHFQRLRSSDAAVAEFIAALAPALASNKLGPLLFQLPPNFPADNPRLAAFLDSPALTANPHLQLAVEFRHPTWFTDATYSILRARNTALCIAEGDDLITPEISTASFHCYRLRRDGGYTPSELVAFATRFTALAQLSEVYAYLRHQDEPTGALNAVTLLQRAAALAGLRA